MTDLDRETYEWRTPIIYLVGYAFLAVTGLKVLRYFVVLLYTSRSALIRHYRRDGKGTWALVTGANGGIGYGFVEELASSGFNVILLGRNEKRLLEAQQKISIAYPDILTKVLVVDASESPAPTLIAALQTISNLPITILINNVGGVPPFKGVPLYRAVPEISPDHLDVYVNMNARFTLWITSLLMPQLALHGPSLILNVSSLSQLGIPMPLILTLYLGHIAYVTPYSASKGFLSSFSLALNLECVAERLPISVHNLLVGDVAASAYEQSSHASWRPMPSSREYAKSVLDRAGLFGSWWHDGVEVIPYPWHQLTVTIVRDLMPDAMFRYILKTEIWKNRTATDGWDGVTFLGDQIKNGEYKSALGLDLGSGGSNDNGGKTGGKAATLDALETKGTPRRSMRQKAE